VITELENLNTVLESLHGLIMTTRIFIGGRQDSQRNCYPTGFEDREKGK
jgi:hypothetical protein